MNIDTTVETGCKFLDQSECVVPKCQRVHLNLKVNYHPFTKKRDNTFMACHLKCIIVRKKCFWWKTYSNMVFISVRNFKLMVSNLKSWFQKLQKSSILKSAALMILWGEEKKGRKNPRFLILKDRGFQAKFVSFLVKIWPCLFF